MMLLRCRLNCYWDAAKLTRAKIIDVAYRSMCPMCGDAGRAETVEHILLECPKWDGYRGDIQPLIDSVRAGRAQHAISQDWKPDVYMCCGGTVANGKSVDLWEQLVDFLDHKNEDEQTQTSNDNLPLDGTDRRERFFVNFIRFLTRVHMERWKIISQIKKNTTGQSPQGYDGAGTAQAQPLDVKDLGGGDALDIDEEQGQ